MGLCYFWECSSSCSSIWTWPQENLTSEGWMALTLCPNAPNKNHMSVPLRMNSQNSGLGLRGSWGEMGFTQTANLSRGMCWIIRVSSSDFLTDVGDWTTMLVSAWVCACVFSSALSFLRLWLQRVWCWVVTPRWDEEMAVCLEVVASESESCKMAYELIPPDRSGFILIEINIETKTISEPFCSPAGQNLDPAETRVNLDKPWTISTEGMRSTLEM